MRFEAISSELTMLVNGKILNLITPWHIVIDTEEETITIRKRNRLLIGVDEEVHSFRYVRRITIDEHLVGADIEIKVVGGTAKAYCLSKSDCRQIKKILLDYNRKRGNSMIIG